MMDLVQHIIDQKSWSEETFGPSDRRGPEGVIDHLRKEIEEVTECPGDLEEWIDIVMLALDGAWRVGFTPWEISAMLASKLEKNRNRDWPDWRTAEPGKAIEHKRVYGFLHPDEEPGR